MAGPKIASTYVGHTQEFVQNPLMFMRTHAVSPPDNTAWKNEFGIPVIPPPVPLRPVKRQWVSATPSQLVPKTPWIPATPSQLKNKWQSAKPSESAKETVEKRQQAAVDKYSKPDPNVERRKWAGGVRYIRISENKRPWELGNTLSFDFLPENQTRVGAWLPINWLPWQPDKILETEIPGVPQSLAEWDDEDYPRFFFTAGISGCSVFVHGNPQSPTISHAGTQRSTGGRPGEFWRQQMALTKSGYASATLRSEVNAHMYAKSSVQAQNLAKKYAEFLSSDKPEFELEVISPVGCIFGIRYGRSWTIYLQKNAVMNKTRFYKQGAVDIRKVEGTKTPFLKGTNTKLKEEPSKVELQKRMLGPLSLGTKESKVFSTSTLVSLPLLVTEMYPNSNFSAELYDVFKAV